MVQSEGEKVCGPGWSDKPNNDNRIVGLIKTNSSQQVSTQINIEVMQRAVATCPKLTWDVGEKIFPHCLTLAVKLH